MPNNLFSYLVEVSFCLAVFSLTYRGLLAKLTHFAWNRAYLVGALLASLALPLLLWPALASWLAPAPVATTSPFWQWHWPAASAAAAAPLAAAAPDLNWWPALGWLAGGLYAAGVAYGLWRLLHDLRWVLQLVRRHPRTRRPGYWLVRVPAPLPAFSFGNSVVLSPTYDALSAADQRLVLQHEVVHVRQGHTYDLLLAEAVGVLLWFHPGVRYLKRQLKDVHELLADEAVTRTADPRQYGHLLVRLAAQQPPVALVHALSSKQIFTRIHALTQPPSPPMKKLRFALVVPVVAAAWLATSAFNLSSNAEIALAGPAAGRPQMTGGPTIGRINWQGNTVVSAAALTQLLGLKAGDVYDSAAVAQRLGMAPDGRDVTSVYMNQGYMFFNVVPNARRQPNGTVDLTLALAEGPQVRIRNVVFSGNKKVATAEVARLVPVHAGELFSRAKLMAAQQQLSQSGLFDPTKVGINPRPVMSGAGLPSQTDIEFVVVEK